MAANLGFMTNPTISGSVPWLTYLNTLIMILILIYIIQYNIFTGVATASILPAQAHAFSNIQEETVTSVILAFIVTMVIAPIVQNSAQTESSTSFSLYR
jgi:membrane protein implicated in regulation of membrane protease activity